MDKKLAGYLDECIEMLRNGESIDACLNRYPEVRDSLAPLLYAALDAADVPEIRPSDDFITGLEQQLRAEHQAMQAAPVRSATETTSVPSGMKSIWAWMTGNATTLRRIAIPVAMVLVLVIGLGFGPLQFFAPAPALASYCTLTVLSGETEILPEGVDTWQPGTDGMVLETGMRIKTAPDSHAMLTFFEGSTVRLDAATEIEIEQVSHDKQQSTRIVLKQWVGKTWSRVTKMIDAGSGFDIETPTAIAAVRGTLFTTDVDTTGATRVGTTEGLVSVVAQGAEVLLPPAQETHVGYGAPPSEPETTPEPESNLIITIRGGAVASVTDPVGASTGSLPDGESFNQIPGSQSVLLNDVQVITVPSPVNGDYAIALQYAGQGSAQVSVQGTAGDSQVFSYDTTRGSSGDFGWIVSLNLEVHDESIAAGNILYVQPLYDEGPVKLAGKSDAKNDDDTSPSFNAVNNGQEPAGGQDENGRENSGGDAENGEEAADEGDTGQQDKTNNGNAYGQNKDSEEDTEAASEQGGGTEEDAGTGAADNQGSQGNNSGNSSEQGNSGNKDGNSGNNNGNSGEQGNSGNSNGNSSAQDNNGNGNGNSSEQDNNGNNGGSSEENGNTGNGDGNSSENGNSGNEGNSGGNSAKHENNANNDKDVNNSGNGDENGSGNGNNGQSEDKSEPPGKTDNSGNSGGDKNKDNDTNKSKQPKEKDK